MTTIVTRSLSCIFSSHIASSYCTIIFVEESIIKAFAQFHMLLAKELHVKISIS